MKTGRILLLFALAFAIYVTVASIRLSRMCEFWDYYNYPHLRYAGSQVTFSELVRYAMWLKPSPGYSWSSCINDLRQVDGAIQQWAMEHGKADQDKPTWDDIKPYLQARTNEPPPCCPYGGRYILGKASERPRCTIARHKLE